MKVYLAAMYQWMEAIKAKRELFHAAGFESTAQWLDGDEEKQLNRHSAATMDLDDVDRADALVLYTLAKGSKFSSGGRFVEFGYALAKDKKIIIVGDRENVFCHLDHVTVVDTTEDAIVVLKSWRDWLNAQLRLDDNFNNGSG